MNGSNVWLKMLYFNLKFFFQTFILTIQACTEIRTP